MTTGILLAFTVALAGGCADAETGDEPTETGADALDSFRSTPSELRGTTVHFLRRRRRPLVLRAPNGAVVVDCDAQASSR